MRMDRRTWLRAMLAAIACGSVARSLAAEEAVAEVVRVRGNVRAGDVPLKAGSPVASGDSIVTGEDGKVDLRFTDGSLLTVGPSSRVEIARYAPKAGGGSGEALLSLLSGIIKLIVNDGTRWSRFSVQTETAVAAVRGTEWLVEAAQGTSAVLVLSGTVEVASRSPGPVFKLGPGQGTDVKAGAAPTPPKIWGAARRDKALARVTW